MVAKEGLSIDCSDTALVHCVYESRIRELRPQFMRQILSVDGIATLETDDLYIDRVKMVWISIFEKDGQVSYLPHHAIDEIRSIRYVYQLDVQSQREEFEAEARGLRKGRITKNAVPVDELFPRIRDLDPSTSYHVPYNEDVMGTKLENKLEFSLADIALKEAVIASSVPIVISHNTFADPSCLLAGIFGEGMHCQAALIERHHNSGKYEVTGDHLRLDVLIDRAETKGVIDESTRSAILEGKLAWYRTSPRNVYSWLRVDHAFLFDQDFGIQLLEAWSEEADRQRDLHDQELLRRLRGFDI